MSCREIERQSKSPQAATHREAAASRCDLHRSAVSERDGLATKHDVRQHGAGNATGDLGRQIGNSGTPRHPTEGGVDEGHHRVEMRSAHRPEHQDDREQSKRRGAGVLGQLKADVVRRQLLSSDTEPTTIVAGSKLPTNSPPSCLPNDGLVTRLA
jgi:hypothetical protein